jgi:hypothetical protein
MAYGLNPRQQALFRAERRIPGSNQSKARTPGTNGHALRWSRVRRAGSRKAERVGFAVATYAAACGLIFGLLAFGFYKLMEPVRLQNSGVLAYKPPPATVLAYPPAALSDVTQAMSPLIEAQRPDDSAVPTPKRVQEPEPPPLTAMAAVPPVHRAVRAKPRPRRTVTTATVHRSTPYFSGGFGAAYPGYASVR